MYVIIIIIFYVWLVVRTVFFFSLEGSKRLCKQKYKNAFTFFFVYFYFSFVQKNRDKIR